MTAPVSSPEISNWQTVVPERPGVAVTDMDIFATHAVLYERHEGRPGVSLLPLLPQQVDLGFSLEAAARQHHTVSHSACTPKLNTDSNRKPSGPSTCSSECNQEGSIYQASCHTERAAAAIQPAIQPASVGCPTNDYVSTRQLQGHAAACTAQQGDASLQTVHLPKWVMDIQPGGNPDHESGTVRLHLSSPVHPQHVYDCHLDTGCLELLGVQQVARHNADDFVCTLQWARSTDGTEVSCQLPESSCCMQHVTDPCRSVALSYVSVSYAAVQSQACITTAHHLLLLLAASASYSLDAKHLCILPAQRGMLFMNTQISAAGDTVNFCLSRHSCSVCNADSHDSSP